MGPRAARPTARGVWSTDQSGSPLLLLSLRNASLQCCSPATRIAERRRVHCDFTRLSFLPKTSQETQHLPKRVRLLCNKDASRRHRSQFSTHPCSSTQRPRWECRFWYLFLPLHSFPARQCIVAYRRTEIPTPLLLQLISQRTGGRKG